MAETVEQLGDELRERALTDGLTKLECAACTVDAWAMDPHGIAELVSHVLAGHGHPQGIIGIKQSTFADPDILRSRLDGTP